MRKVFRWLGILVGGLVGLVVLALVGLSLAGGARINRKYDVKVESVPIPTDAESIAAGKHWVQAVCVGCHRADLSGGPIFEAPFAYVDTANLTSGKGGVGATFSDEDWVRAIRHGVTPDGRSVIIMPAQFFWNFNDQDLGEIIAYLKSLPPVDHETRQPWMNFFGKALLAAGQFGKAVLPAEVVPQGSRPSEFPSPGVTPEYGQYLVNVSGCHDCHGPDLSGGKNADPNAMTAPNLTPGGELAAWEQADFVQVIRTGVTPSGHPLDPAEMPWKDFQNYSDDELSAIWMYLHSLPKLPTTVP